jgi:hypothetical protein
MSRNIKSSTKTNKTKKPAKSKKLTSKKASKPVADYISVNGHVYERVSSDSKNVEFDLAEDVLSKIDGRIDSGEFVSRGDAIRHILRTILESKKGLK